MSKQFILLITLVTVVISALSHRCYAQQNEKSTACLTISVIADFTGKPIAGAEVRVEGSDGSTQTDSTNTVGIASFAAMQQKVVYNISVSLSNYYSEKTTMYLTDTVSDQHIDFRMTKIKRLGNPLPQVAFRKSSVRFAEYNEEGLKIMVSILKENSSLTIAISGHTNPDEKEKLGQKRAEKIRNIIIAQGVDAARISIDTTQQCESDCGEIENISNSDSGGKVITKAYLKTLSKKDRKKAAESCRQVRFRITGIDFGE